MSEGLAPEQMLGQMEQVLHSKGPDGLVLPESARNFIDLIEQLDRTNPLDKNLELRGSVRLLGNLPQVWISAREMLTEADSSSDPDSVRRIAHVGSILGMTEAGEDPIISNYFRQVLSKYPESQPSETAPVQPDQNKEDLINAQNAVEKYGSREKALERGRRLQQTYIGDPENQATIARIIKVLEALPEQVEPATPVTDPNVITIPPEFVPPAEPTSEDLNRPEAALPPLVQKLIDEEGIEKVRTMAELSAQSSDPKVKASGEKMLLLLNTYTPPAKPPTESGVELNDSAEKFVKAVIRRNVHGKLPEGTKIIGTKGVSTQVGGFYDHGPDQIRLSPLEGQLLEVIYGNQDKLPDLINSHFVSITPSLGDQGSSMVVTIHFFQDRGAPDNRGYYTPGHVSAVLPSSIISEFLDELAENPDLLEDFYQKVFPGLDSREEAPGMHRAKADGFFLITGDKLTEASKINKYDTGAATAFYSSLEKYHYQHGPYGTGYPFKSNSRRT